MGTAQPAQKNIYSRHTAPATPSSPQRSGVGGVARARRFGVRNDGAPRGGHWRAPMGAVQAQPAGLVDKNIIWKDEEWRGGTVVVGGERREEACNPKNTLRHRIWKGAIEGHAWSLGSAPACESSDGCLPNGYATARAAHDALFLRLSLISPNWSHLAKSQRGSLQPAIG